MSKFRIAMSSDFLQPDGSPSFPEFDLGPIRRPEVEYFYLPADRQASIKKSSRRGGH